MGTPVVLKKVPKADIDRVIEILEISGATDIEKIPNDDGTTFTVKFTQPDDD